MGSENAHKPADQNRVVEKQVGSVTPPGIQTESRPGLRENKEKVQAALLLA